MNMPVREAMEATELSIPPVISTIVTFVYYFGIVSEATMFFKAVIIAVIIVLQSEPMRNWFAKRSKAKAMAKGGAQNV